MQFNYHIVTKVLFGKGCILQNKSEFGRFGSKVLIVTGSGSAKQSGALVDVCRALNELNIEYGIFDGIENNPSLDTVEKGGIAARSLRADYIIGIGGGSPLDASKAVAVLTSNDIDPVGLFVNTFKNRPLPIIAVPTTAGTGSEVTQYSILTRNDLQTKMSFGNQYTFPALAFMDASYTETMPYEVTVNTAIDALCHAVEGYLSRRSNPVSDIFAVEAITVFGQCLNKLVNNTIDFSIREKLLYAAMLGGMVISHTGTTIIHGMGYNLTFFKGVPHGKANGLLMEEYLKFNYDFAKNKIDNVLQLLNVRNINEFGDVINTLIGRGQRLQVSEIEKFSSISMQQKNTSYNIRNVNMEDIVNIYKTVFNGE